MCGGYDDRGILPYRYILVNSRLRWGHLIVAEVVEGIEEDLGQVAFDDFFERIPAFAQAVIGEAILREVVGFDFLAPHASADGGGPTGLDFTQAFGLFSFPELGA